IPASTRHGRSRDTEVDSHVPVLHAEPQRLTAPLSSPAPARGESQAAMELQRILRLNVPVIVKLAERKLSLSEVLRLGTGAIIELPVVHLVQHALEQLPRLKPLCDQTIPRDQRRRRAIGLCQSLKVDQQRIDHAPIETRNAPNRLKQLHRRPSRRGGEEPL